MGAWVEIEISSYIKDAVIKNAKNKKRCPFNEVIQSNIEVVQGNVYNRENRIIFRRWKESLSICL